MSSFQHKKITRHIDKRVLVQSIETSKSIETVPERANTVDRKFKTIVLKAFRTKEDGGIKKMKSKPSALPPHVEQAHRRLKAVGCQV